MNTLVKKAMAVVNTLMLIAMPAAAGIAAEYDQYGSQQNISAMHSVNQVSMMDDYFSPKNITVQVGTTVTWKNNGSHIHSVTADNHSFDSGVIYSGATWSYTFNEVGTFPYYCKFHGAPGGIGMTGTVTVVSQNMPPYPVPNPHSLNATVVQSSPGAGLTITKITPVKTQGIADATFENGWKWIFDVTAPTNETNLMMRFSDWFKTNFPTGHIMPVSNNMRFFSSQSSNAFNETSAIMITAPNTYSASMMLTGDMSSSQAGRQIQITVQTRIPNGTPDGNYSTNFAIRTQ